MIRLAHFSDIHIGSPRHVKVLHPVLFNFRIASIPSISVCLVGVKERYHLLHLFDWMLKLTFRKALHFNGRRIVVDGGEKVNELRPCKKLLPLLS